MLEQMDLDEQLQLAHLLLQERKCRVCGEEKNLIDGYYRTRKNVRLASSYSYECKECTVKRVCENNRRNKLKKNRMKKMKLTETNQQLIDRYQGKIYDLLERRREIQEVLIPQLLNEERELEIELSRAEGSLDAVKYLSSNKRARHSDLDALD